MLRNLGYIIIHCSSYAYKNKKNSDMEMSEPSLVFQVLQR